MSKPDLAIIIPFAGEYPQVLFTIQAIAQSLLRSDINFEIIAVDNYCQELEKQWQNIDNREGMRFEERLRRNETDSIQGMQDAIQKIPKCYRSNKAGEAIRACARGNDWLTYMHFEDRLSHWECKRLACELTEADTFLFIDAHCVPSLGIDEMYKAYSRFRTQGSFHMPLTYKILEWHRLVYKLRVENGFWGYAFTGFTSASDIQAPPEVPCMSTCGMMLSREVYDKIGGWPTHMTMYGGGENFMNFALAACGFKKWIFPPVTLHHHGEGRDYHYTHDGIVWNRLVAHYLFGGIQRLQKLAENTKGNPQLIKNWVSDIISSKTYKTHRDIIRENTNTDLDHWRKLWEG